MAVQDHEMDMDVIEVPIEDPIISAEERAEAKKQLGNDQYKLKQYRNALPFYSTAIELCPENASYYGNRSACHMMLGDYKEALNDARKSVALDPTFVKGLVRIAKCSIALGDTAAAENALTRAASIEPGNTSLNSDMASVQTVRHHLEEARKAEEKGDYRKVVYCMDRALDVAPACQRFRLLKAESLSHLGRYQEAQELANEVLGRDKNNADAVLVRGFCLYYQDNIDRALQHFQHVLKLAPDHPKAQDVYRKAKSLSKKKEEGNEAFKTGKIQEAYNLYSEALKIDPINKLTNAKIYFNRATVSSKLGRLNEAVADCTKALELDDTYLKALLRRAKCYMDLSDYEEAVKDYEKAFKMDKSRENKRLLQEAKTELKRSKRKDYYKILGIDRNATDDEIKKAYRKRALDHHPDRHANATDHEKKEQEKKFKEVGEAYGVLLDPKKRSRYDNGQDMEDEEGFGGMDPTNLFNAFYGADLGEGFNFHSQGFPSGFTFQFG